MSSPPIITVQQGFGWFLGSFENNRLHNHVAIQLSIPLETPVSLIVNGSELRTDQALLIKSNTKHLISCEQEHLVILFNPSSPQGHFWSPLVLEPLTELNHPATTEIKEVALQLLVSNPNREELISKMNQVIGQYDCFCGAFIHHGDPRIEKAIAYLNLYSERVIPVAEIADHCHLSSSRFQHLFKEVTGQTYRRAQLWNKITNALPLLGKYPLTEIAHQSGFADSAHFSRTFKENFGFSPRELLKVSSFIQV